MKSNLEITEKEFIISQYIKQSIVNIDNPLRAKEFLVSALRVVHG
jgi:hypothetical protein